MNYLYSKGCIRLFFSMACLAATSIFVPVSATAQSCPTSITTASLSTYPNTYFPGSPGNLNAGSLSTTVGAVTYGSDPIKPGDILLVIQMQGSQINSTNSNAYGKGTSTGSGYLNNSNLKAGNMEFVVAANNVPLAGGTLNFSTALVNNYVNANFGTDGQYKYQIIRVPVYYRVKLSGNITAPLWWGPSSSSLFSGGVVVIYAVDSIILNSYTISAAGKGFAGGAGLVWGGAGSSTTMTYSDYVTLSSGNANGSKGEGISGTPKYTNINNARYTNSFEGYPNGSYGQGAPGNAGGGGTDGNPQSNNENTGGGGGGNGGAGGTGGKAWNSGRASGGMGGAPFNQASPSRLVMGGGGGAGTTNDGTGTPGGGIASSGASGGGIVILIANTISGPGTINVNGADANQTVANDGAGGGGAGGSVLIYSKTGTLSNITVTANGGAGGTNESGGGSSHGPGGGGGGGVIYSNMALNAASSSNAGVAGTTVAGSSNYGASSGSGGAVTQNILQTQTPTFPLSCTILPLSFLSVSAEKQSGLVEISWQVTNEVNTLSYDVEKSLDGRTFSPIGTILYKQGHSGINRYSYGDNIGLGSNGTLYYRIIEKDASGNFLYSKIVSIEPQVNRSGNQFSVFPNPVRSSATISFTSERQGMVNMRLIDMRGGVVWQQSYKAVTGTNTTSLDLGNSVRNGIYILQLFDGLNKEQIKVLVNQ